MFNQVIQDIIEELKRMPDVRKYNSQLPNLPPCAIKLGFAPMICRRLIVLVTMLDNQLADLDQVMNIVRGDNIADRMIQISKMIEVLNVVIADILQNTFKAAHEEVFLENARFIITDDWLVSLIILKKTVLLGEPEASHFTPAELRIISPLLVHAIT